MAADASGPEPSPGNHDRRGERSELTDAQKALRAQLLATEHWSLLASRSTTQSEVLTRIAIFLTLVSAGLISLGVLGQATGFRGWFGVAALGILFLLLCLGVITCVRAFNTATEDMMYVVAMNRLRGAYLDLAPDLEPYFMASPYDDVDGVTRTYHFFYPRTDLTVVFGSSMMIITVVTAVVAGLFSGGLVAALGGAIWLAVTVGVVVGVAAIVLALARGQRLYLRSFREHAPLKRTPPE
ncbi:hypothetical protein [Agromyces silvae]|uniref:hypothetical protein n=1 Tax=Agromyces silvae TaxID=3388266 RepID=UPI00280BD7FA|nr:hypothetical protein [Agromyces protaetiae]